MGLENVKERKELIVELKAVQNVLARECFRISTTRSAVLPDAGKLGKVIRPTSYTKDFKLCTPTTTLEIQHDSVRLPNAALKSTNDYHEILKQKDIAKKLIESVQQNLENVITEKESLSAKLKECTLGAGVTEEKVIAAVKDGQVSEAQLEAEVTDTQELLKRNTTYQQRMSAMPVQPGFIFSPRNISNLIHQRQAALEDVKSQVLALSIT